MKKHYLSFISVFFALALGANPGWAFGKKQISSFTPDPMVSNDPMIAPVVPKPGDLNYGVNVKFTNHGLTVPSETLPRLIHAVEVIYSQCEGVNFHVNVVSETTAPYTTDQDGVTEVAPPGVVALGDQFEKFYSEFPNSPETGLISVDLVDDLEASVRDSEASGSPSESFLGQALPSTIMNNLYKDMRSAQYQKTLPSEVGGNTIRLGMSTLKIAESTAGPVFHENESYTDGSAVLDSNGKPIAIQAFRGLQSSLLAHEMGHILMDPQNGLGTYIDHYCQDLGVTCPRGYLMSSGGFSDKTYLRVPQMDIPIGYSPLPTVEKGQCEALIRHPLVKAMN
jgi:hypothetical protein